jgi:hypothetical protein
MGVSGGDGSGGSEVSPVLPSGKNPDLSSIFPDRRPWRRLVRCPRQRHRLARRRPSPAHPPRRRPTRGPWESKETAYDITSLPANLAGPRQLAIYARNHWGNLKREHYVRDAHSGRTHRKPAPESSRTPTLASATS